MNTGIGDAVNLGWKLAADLQGWAGAELLNSYEHERRSIALQNRVIRSNGTKNTLKAKTLTYRSFQASKSPSTRQTLQIHPSDFLLSVDAFLPGELHQKSQNDSDRAY